MQTVQSVAQRRHWQVIHESRNLAQALDFSSRCRCLVATRKIAAGELVFEERPLAVGPLHDTVPVCLTCFKTVRLYFNKSKI